MDNKKLLVDSAYSKIRRGIFDGVYPPGSKLTTQELSSALGMSRTPIVAAINRLIAQGLVTDIPHRGFIVTELRPKQLRNFIDVRKMMESYVVPSAIRNVNFLSSVTDEMEETAKRLTELSDTSYEEITTLENSFHTNFIRLGNNEQLLKLYESNWGIGFAVYTYLQANMPVKRYTASCQEHMLFLEYLYNGDEKRLSEIVNTHLDIVYATLDWIESSNNW